MKIVMRSAFAALALAAVGPACAAGEPGENEPVEDCGTKASLYTAAKGLKLWVLRRGAMVLGENPLRPLTRDTVRVLEVVVNGRLATAYGADYASLRQGGPARDLEKESADPIRWEPRGPGFPTEIRIVGEDGTDLFGPFRFSRCDEAPSARAVGAGRPERAARPSGGPPPVRDGSRLPQGAIQGLDLRGGARP